MRVCIRRGSKQIGGSCVELEASGQRVVLDLGLPLDAESNNLHLLPAIQGIDGNDPSLLGILISHPHLDHYGLLAHVSNHVKIGLGASAREYCKQHPILCRETGRCRHQGGTMRRGKRS
jgi:ribonuclease J